MGSSGMGNLVDVGSPADAHAGVVANLCQLSRSAPFSSGGQTPLLAAVLAVFGALDVPLVYFSIWFFRTQHPQPVIGGGGSIDPRMLHALLINLAGFSCFGALVCWSRYKLEVVKRDVEERQALEALMETGSPR